MQNDQHTPLKFDSATLTVVGPAKEIAAFRRTIQDAGIGRSSSGLQLKERMSCCLVFSEDASKEDQELGVVRWVDDELLDEETSELTFQLVLTSGLDVYREMLVHNGCVEYRSNWVVDAAGEVIMLTSRGREGATEYWTQLHAHWRHKSSPFYIRALKRLFRRAK